MSRLTIALPLVALTMALSGCVRGVEFVPTGQVMIDQDGTITASGGLTVAPTFNGKYGK